MALILLSPFYWQEQVSKFLHLPHLYANAVPNQPAFNALFKSLSILVRLDHWPYSFGLWRYRIL